MPIGKTHCQEAADRSRNIANCEEITTTKTKDHIVALADETVDLPESVAENTLDVLNKGGENLDGSVLGRDVA